MIRLYMARYKKCLYCGENYESMDHVPAKLLLQKPFPKNLITIPACIKCNTSFSKDEEYFLNVLVELTTNRDLLAKKQFGGPIFKARMRSKGLDSFIKSSLIPKKDGRIYFQGEIKRIYRVIEKIAFGLFFHKYKKVVSLSSFKCVGFYPYNVDELRPTDTYLLTYTEKFKSKRWSVVQPNVFEYIVVRDWTRKNSFTMILNVHNTAWCVVALPYHRELASNSSQIPIQF